MKNRYLIAGLLALALIAGTVECPAATPKPPVKPARVAPAPVVKPSVTPALYYKAADIEQVKANLRRIICNVGLLEGLFAEHPAAVIVFQRQAEAYDRALEMLEKLPPPQAK